MPGTWTGMNAQAAKIEYSTDYRTQNIKDVFGWPVVLDGTGVIIAFADTGVSRATETADSLSVAGGYDGFTRTVGNHDPTVTADG